MQSLNQTIQEYLFSDDVHIGRWTNHAAEGSTIKHAFLAPTITLKSNQGRILIAFIALFVRLSGSQLWSLMCYAMHQYRSSQKAKDGLYHQQQAILRNNNSDTGAIWQLTKLSYRWRRRAPKGLYRSVSIMVIAALHFVAFIAAGILSSKVAQSSDEVLLRGTYSVDWISFLENAYDTNASFPFDPTDAYFLQRRQEVVKSLDYASTCYRQNSSLATVGCESFVQKRFNATISGSKGCPFGDLCYNAKSEVIQIDSGFLDSTRHLGINAREKDRVQFRNMLSCAPLKTNGHVSNQWDLVPKDEYGAPRATQEMFIKYNYGTTWSIDMYSYYNSPAYELYANSTDPPLPRPPEPAYIPTNYTWLYSNMSNLAQTFSESSFFLELMVPSLEDNSTYDFKPLPGLDRQDASVSLLFLTNFGSPRPKWDPTVENVTKPIRDPWFGFTQNLTSLSGAPEGEPTSLPGVLACAEQYEVCNPMPKGQPKCTGLLSYPSLRDAWQNDTTLELNDAQNATLLLILQQTRGLSEVYDHLGTSALAAQDLVIDKYGTTKDIPDDQWKVEAKNLHSLAMIALQVGLEYYAKGPIELDVKYSLPIFSDGHTRELSRQIIVRDSNYTSFSACALAVILVIGTSFFIANQTMDYIVGYFQKRLQRGEYPRQEWHAGETLQLQRQAFEAHGHGQWKRFDGIPVTEYGQRFSLPQRRGYHGAPGPVAPMSPQATVVEVKSVPSSEQDVGVIGDEKMPERVVVKSD